MAWSADSSLPLATKGLVQCPSSVHSTDDEVGGGMRFRQEVSPAASNDMIGASVSSTSSVDKRQDSVGWEIPPFQDYVSCGENSQ
jgi:hypothetical protein